MNYFIKNVLSIGVLFGATALAPALADDAGEADYTEFCATCHGAAGMGQGPMAEVMSVDVPDLTTIAQRNDNAFPTLKIMHIVDGRTGLRGHGSSMPVWGTQFASGGSGMKGDYGPVYRSRGRVLSIVYYLESIQK